MDTIIFEAHVLLTNKINKFYYYFVLFFSQSHDNEYVRAIRSVGSVLAPYDSDQLIPVFGFGARVPPNGEVSHCFPLNFNPHKPDVFGVQVCHFLLFGKFL